MFKSPEALRNMATDLCPQSIPHQILMSTLLCITLFSINSSRAAPCDIYASAGTPCAAAHSIVRALYSGYDGRLYQLMRFANATNTTLDIHTLEPGGVADAVSHDTFCTLPWVGGSYPPRSDCVIWQIYDQTGNGNHMLPATPAISNPAYDNPVNASRHPITVGGRKVYGAYFETGMGYRAQNTTAVAKGNDPETIYMVTSGTHVNAGCCFDYGNSENDCTNSSAYCDGCMEAVYFGTGGGWCGGPGSDPSDPGPWVLADLENGLWGCNEQGGKNLNNTGLASEFVTAMVKGGTRNFAIKGADATAGELKLMWDGPRPPGYQPMQKTGAIILGVGGDNMARKVDDAQIPGLSIGTFYEGLLTVGYSSDAADAAVQADIVAAGYGK